MQGDEGRSDGSSECHKISEATAENSCFPAFKSVELAPSGQTPQRYWLTVTNRAPYFSRQIPLYTSVHHCPGVYSAFTRSICKSPITGFKSRDPNDA